MTHLLPPPPDTPVARRGPDPMFRQAGKWHIMRGEQKTMCGQILVSLYQIDRATLGDPLVLSSDMCRECWPWEANDGQLPLFAAASAAPALRREGSE